MADGTSVGVIQQIDDERRGAYQYWGVFFAVTNKAQAIQTITRNGGRVLVDDGSYISCLDHSGSAFFFLVEVAESSSRLDRLFPYKPLVALVVIFVSLALSWYGIFGVLFLLFAYHDIRSGHTYLFDVVYKKNNPLLFWVIVGTWVLLSIVSIVYYTYVIVI